MKRPTADTGSILSVALKIAPIALAGLLLAGCETTNPSPPPAPQAAAAPVEDDEPPMTQARAAQECWKAAEKRNAGASIDKRADVVTRCIDDKLKTAEKAANG